MVPCWGWPFTRYLAIKLEKFAKCPAEGIVKYGLSNNYSKKNPNKTM